MNIRFSKKFEKQLAKCTPKIEQRFYKHLTTFRTNPYSPELNNHALKGKYQGFYSINVTGDVRALYTKHGTKVIIFGFIGTHSQLYE
jgi:addiction module RelE/StbE family toxin